MSGWHAFAGKVCVLMAVLALEGIEAFAIGAAFHVLKVWMTVFALQWSVSNGMAIHAARVHEYRIRGEKGGARSRFVPGWGSLNGSSTRASRRGSGLPVLTTAGDQEKSES
jgi:hypothetical protein